MKFYDCDNVACSSGTASTLDSLNTVGLYVDIASDVYNKDASIVISYVYSSGTQLKAHITGSFSGGYLLDSNGKINNDSYCGASQSIACCS